MVSYIEFAMLQWDLLVVLILIVVDNGLVPADITVEAWMKGVAVLILIVVDNGLVLDLIRLF